jgi:hypothetical protein
MSKAFVLAAVACICVMLLGIAKYDAHYADRVHQTRPIG